jgi:glucuronoarabinoxylan endo-1,4-beta-xylanase
MFVSFCTTLTTNTTTSPFFPTCFTWISFLPLAHRAQLAAKPRVVHNVQNMKGQFFIAILLSGIMGMQPASAQEIKVNVDIQQQRQQMEGFGAALAYYEGWLTAHPNKAEIYEAIYKELSLDFLRVRNAHEYDPGMLDRVKEFITASQGTQGRPIPFLSTSWGPPARLKSNKDTKNGGTLKYTVENGKVSFDYEGFALWWDASLDAYAAKGLYPTFISIQNEPDYIATWESCILNPFEKVNATDTLAGYNKALKAVHDKVSLREKAPRFLGPESIGIGYNAVKNYLLQADTTLLYGVGHHLYHGIDKDNPWGNTEMKKLRELYPNLRFFQTEYSGNDWFNMTGLIYKSLADEEVSAYFYWDLIWDNGGLVSLDNPWNRGGWKNTRGYEKTKHFYAFKQFSAFIHPGWRQVAVTLASSEVHAVGFISPGMDSLSVVIINRSAVSEKTVRFELPGFEFSQSDVYVTSNSLNCSNEGVLDEPVFTLPPTSVTTAFFSTTYRSSNNELPFAETRERAIYPNPFTEQFHLGGQLPAEGWHLYSDQGQKLLSGKGKTVEASELPQGLYLLKIGRELHKVVKQ